MSYKLFGIVLVVSRLAIAIRYTVVMWLDRLFGQTLVSMGFSTVVYAIDVVGYGITISLYPKGKVGLKKKIA
jgi:uncharacterized protein (DUF697 family)